MILRGRLLSSSESALMLQLAGHVPHSACPDRHLRVCESSVSVHFIFRFLTFVQLPRALGTAALRTHDYSS